MLGECRETVFLQSQCVSAMQSDAYSSDQCQGSAGEGGWCRFGRGGGRLHFSSQYIHWFGTHISVCLLSYYLSVCVPFSASLTCLFMLSFLTPISILSLKQNHSTTSTNTTTTNTTTSTPTPSSLKAPRTHYMQTNCPCSPVRWPSSRLREFRSLKRTGVLPEALFMRDAQQSTTLNLAI